MLSIRTVIAGYELQARNKYSGETLQSWSERREVKESRDGAVSVALTFGNLGRPDDRAKCSGGRQTGSETTVVQRWSWHEKQTFCSVWEICVWENWLVCGHRSLAFVCVSKMTQFLKLQSYKIPPTSDLS